MFELPLLPSKKLPTGKEERGKKLETPERSILTQLNAPPEASPATRHAEIGDAIRAATREVFSTMVGLDAVPGETVVTRSSAGPGVSRHYPGVMAFLGLTGEWSGSGQFSCAPELACRIAGQMLLSDYPAVNEEVLDVVSEVANMIIGNIKNTLELRLGPMGLSTPTVVSGSDFDARIAGNPERVAVPFQCGGDSMTVQVVLARTATSGRAKARRSTTQVTVPARTA